MKIQTRISRSILLALLSACAAAGGRAQQSADQQDLPRLSEPAHMTRYAEVICPHCIMPQWDLGYLLRHEIERNSNPEHPMVTMFDRDGKKILEGQIWAPNFTSVTVMTVGATHSGGILAGARGIMTDGSIESFVSKTDQTGRPFQSVRTGQFHVGQVCEAPDGTVWALGYNWDRKLQDSDVLRHYSFERGLLGSFLPLDSISKASDAVIGIDASGESFLRCGKEKISVYYSLTAEYIEMDSSGEKLAHWKVGPLSITRAMTTGFAVTEEGRVFVSFQHGRCENCQTSFGLYEIRPRAGASTLSLIPVRGTFGLFDPKEDLPEGTVTRLWGAEGNQLVVSRHGDGWDLAWVSVSPQIANPDFGN